LFYKKKYNSYVQLLFVNLLALLSKFETSYDEKFLWELTTRKTRIFTWLKNEVPSK